MYSVISQPAFHGGCPSMNVREYNQHQKLMFPPHLTDFLADDHQAMIINDVVETFDFTNLYRKLSSEGNPAYHPKMMIKVLIYAYANGIFSSRKIQDALLESIAFIYLSGWQKPDFRTISDFRKNNLQEFKALFNQLVDICKQLGMVSLGHIAIDSSKFKANASDKRTYDKERVAKAIDKLLKQAEQVDQREDRLFGADNTGKQVPEQIQQREKRLKKLQQIKDQLVQSDKQKINATDSDAVFMKTSNGLKTAYNAQVAAEQSHSVIIAADVSNDPSDTAHLVPTVEQVENSCGALDKISADSGYSSGENLQAMVDKCIDAYIPDANYQGSRRGKKDAPAEGLFPRTCFQRDELQDCFICPAGQKLTFSHLQKVKNKKPLRLYRCRNFKDCPLRQRCTKSRKGRSITLNAHADQFKAMRTKLDSAYGKRMYAKRQSMVEPVFGHIKEVIGFSKLHLRGLQKVRGEFLLICIAHNMRKIINALRAPDVFSMRQKVSGATGQ